MIYFIILLGLVSFFADIAYEGARSIIGPFFALLGASGAVVGTFAGLAEFAGYAIRIISGVAADRSKNYWLLTAVGYLCNLIVIPLFALAGIWQTAAVLLVLERSGKALRTPSRDAMLSYACKQVGHGWGFGLHEAFDRFGGLIGPLLMYFILSTGPRFQLGFGILALPAAAALAILYMTYRRFPHPEVTEPSKTPLSFKNFSRSFWIFLSGAALVGAGTLDFALVAYHIQKSALVASPIIPLYYMAAIVVAALFALIGGKWFDKAPKPALYCGILLGSISPLLLFLGTHTELWIGMVCWGVGMATQTALFRSVLVSLIPSQQRSTGYGLFGVLYGLGWFLGSALIGKLYDTSTGLSAIASVVLQLLSMPLFFKVSIRSPNSNEL